MDNVNEMRDCNMSVICNVIIVVIVAGILINQPSSEPPRLAGFLADGYLHVMPSLTFISALIECKICLVTKVHIK